MANETVLVGTSGFSYKDWLGNFYPQFCPPADFLKFYTSQFKTVEIDSTFYRIPDRTTVEKWKKTVPEGFIFSAKFPQTVTHKGGLSERIETARVFIETMKLLDDKLGPLLLQFPYKFAPDHFDLLSGLLRELPRDVKVVLELRNRKWLQHQILFEQLREQGIAFCLIDHPWMPRTDIATADLVYLRFLGDRQQIENDFSYIRKDRAEELRWWGELVSRFAQEGKTVFAYFNNHYSGHSPTTARAFQELLEIAPARRIIR